MKQMGKKVIKVKIGKIRKIKYYEKKIDMSYPLKLFFKNVKRVSFER